jgi:hypothetical protein
MSRAKRKKLQKVVTSMEVPELLRIIRDDILFLQDLNFSGPTRSEVRFASMVLRRLLHEGLLLTGWHLCGEKNYPIITATDLESMLGEVPRQFIQYAYAGGASTVGAQHNGYILLSIPKRVFLKWSGKIGEWLNSPKLTRPISSIPNGN